MDNQQLPNFFKKRVDLTPDRSALKFKSKEWTFKELYDLSFNMAGLLRANGVKDKQYVAVLLKNHVDTVVILLALQLIGARAVILNIRLTAQEIIWQLNDSKAKYLIAEDLFEEVLTDVRNSTSSSVFTKEELMESSFIEPTIQEEVDLMDVCTIMYTSGTTGNPKGVIQTFGNHWWSAVGSALNLGITEDDCWLCTVPLFHISGYSILMRSLIYGMKVVLHESFSEKDVLMDIRNERVSIMSVVSTMLMRVVEALGDEKLPSLFRCMLLGGGPAPLPLLEKCVAKDIPVYQSYGMTETSSQIVTLTPEYSISKLGSAGKPLFPSQLKIIDSLGNENRANQSGEIVVKGPNVTRGYLNREKATKESIKDGWFYTGDIGFVDEEGFLFVQDRRSDLIISGGENIYPAEVEGILISHPSVLDAGVIGKSDQKWGQVPIAFVVNKDSVNEDDIINFCLLKLAKYKVPKQVIFVEELPRNASKKLLRRKLRESLEEG